MPEKKKSLIVLLGQSALLFAVLDSTYPIVAQPVAPRAKPVAVILDRLKPVQIGCGAIQIAASGFHPRQIVQHQNLEVTTVKNGQKVPGQRDCRPPNWDTEPRTVGPQRLSLVFLALYTIPMPPWPISFKILKTGLRVILFGFQRSQFLRKRVFEAKFPRSSPASHKKF